MARGLLGGMIFGGAVSLVAAGAISVLLDPPTRPEVTDLAPQKTDVPTPPDKEAAAGFGDADLVQGGSARPTVAQESGDASVVASAGGDTPLVPETGLGASEGLSSIAGEGESAGVKVSENEPVLPVPQAALPQAPGAEVELSISTEPAQPPVPKVEDPLENLEAETLEAPVAPTAPAAEDAEPEIAVLTSEPVQPNPEAAPSPVQPTAEVQPAADQEPAAALAVVEPEVEAESEVEAAEVEAEVEADPIEVVDAPASDDDRATPEAAPSVQDDVAAVEAPEEPALEETVTRDAAEPNLAGTTNAEEVETAVLAQNDDRRLIGRPARSIIGRNATEEPSGEAEEETAEAPVPSGPPLEAFATKFDDPGGRPLMAVVLIDEGGDLENLETGLQALANIPFPISFAIDTSAPDAKARMKAFRDAGHEVLALLDLPSGATAQDAAINLDAAFINVPEAVAVIEGSGNGVQESKDVTDLMISELVSTGRGFVLQAKGLNSAYRDAERAGLPSQIVFRDVDSAGQSARTIGRFLEQAAFRARQEGGVIMMGRMRSETISALQIWDGQERSDSVAMAPVSAVLTQ